MSKIFTRKLVYDILESVVLKAVLMLLKISGGFKAKLVALLVEQGFERVLIPLMNYLYREGMLFIDTQSGKRKVIKLRKANDGGNDAEIDGAIDDIFNS